MPARTMLSVTRELKATATVEFAAGVGTVETDPRSRYRYSSLAVQLPARRPSMPPPTVQPALVLWLLTMVLTGLPSPSKPNTVPAVMTSPDRETAGHVSKSIGCDRCTQSPAQRREPLQFLALLGDRQHRRVADNSDKRRIADFAGAAGSHSRALAGIVQIRFHAGQDVAGNPVVAALRTADGALELAELAGGEQLARADGIAERRVRVGFAPAVADGAADIEAGPGPRRADRRLEHHGPIYARWCNVERSARIEFVVEADAHEIFRDAGIEGDGEWGRIRRQDRGGRDVTEIQVKVLDLAGPVATETNLRAGANRPPCLRLLAEEGGACGVGAGDDDGDIDRDFDGVTIGVDIDGDALGDAVGETENSSR